MRASVSMPRTITGSATAYLTGNLNATLTLDDYVGEYAADYDMDAATSGFRTQIAGILAQFRPDWTIAGNFIFGDYPAVPLTEEEQAEIAEAITMIDVAEILETHTN